MSPAKLAPERGDSPWAPGLLDSECLGRLVCPSIAGAPGVSLTDWNLPPLQGVLVTFSGRWYLETKIWVLWVLTTLALGHHCSPPCVCMYVCVYPYRHTHPLTYTWTHVFLLLNFPGQPAAGFLCDFMLVTILV